MDFFSAGGFQQLFSDLHAEPPPEIVETLQFRNPDFGQSEPTIDEFADDIFSKTTCDTYAESSEPEQFFGVPPTLTFCNYDDYCPDLPAIDAVVVTNNQFVDVSAGAAFFDHNNNIGDGGDDGDAFILANISDKRLQQSLDFLLPAEEDTIEHDEPDTGLFMTREMAEWEEKFLDNYIEIPELIDFLPEKTPLCTEMCELHLLESSQQLQLQLHHTKKKSKKWSSIGASPPMFLDPERGGYACSFGPCRKIYAKPAHLKAHLRRHLGEKPYACTWPECVWKFSRSDELARHRRSHSGVKPYKCDYCTKCFARSDHLTKHRKVHERRMLAASEAGRAIDGVMPQSVFTVRPGRKRKNQIC